VVVVLTEVVSVETVVSAVVSVVVVLSVVSVFVVEASVEVSKTLYIDSTYKIRVNTHCQQRVNFIIFCKVFYVKSKFKYSKIKYVPSGSKYGNEMLTLAPSVEETSLFFLAPENNLCV
jgi:hypothetical protein